MFGSSLSGMPRPVSLTRIATRSGFAPEGAVAPQEGCEVALHRGQRCAQIKPNIGEPLASLYLALRQQLELLCDALRHFLHRNGELVDVVTVRVDGCQAYGLDES